MARITRAIYWRCFHCGEGFTRAQRRWAREHFGGNEQEISVCQMRVPGEGQILTVLRRQQDELDGYRSEDTNLVRALLSQSADHTSALRREEEKGYDRGVTDARAESAALAAAATELVDALTLATSSATGTVVERRLWDDVERELRTMLGPR